MSELTSLQHDAKLVLSLTDLTSLNHSDTEEVINALCAKANGELGNTAAVCVYPEFISIAKKALGDAPVKIATVTNFPESTKPYQEVVEETKFSLAQGANEVDIVFPYAEFLAKVANHGVWDASEEKLVNVEEILAPITAFLKQNADLCHQAGAQLKVIIESGALVHPYFIALASESSIKAGADFIKTSTGKIGVHATLNAAKVMLETIKRLNSNCGFKASGGIRTVKEAMAYINLAKEILGEDFITAEKFRFGASGIYADIESILTTGEPLAKSGTGY